MPITDSRALLTALDVAARLSLSRATIYRLAEGGQIPAKRISGSWRFDQRELEAWIDEPMNLGRGTHD